MVVVYDVVDDVVAVIFGDVIAFDSDDDDDDGPMRCPYGPRHAPVRDTVALAQMNAVLLGG